MQTKKFQKKKEDFICQNCGYKTQGNGYTNHCPECLWSKHVDINPGDRLETCKGLMKPISINLKQGDYHILHQCIKCGFERYNKTNEKDNTNKIIELSNHIHNIDK